MASSEDAAGGTGDTGAAAGQTLAAAAKSTAADDPTVPGPDRLAAAEPLILAAPQRSKPRTEPWGRADETEPEPSLQPVPQPVPQPVSQSVQRRWRGFVPVVLGGVVAAGLGYGVAQVVPDGWPVAIDRAELVALQDGQAAATARAEALAAEIAAQGRSLARSLAEVPSAAALADLAARISKLETAAVEQGAATELRLSEIANAAAALDARVNTLERRPVQGGAASDTALSAYEDEIKALRAMVEAQQAQSATVGEDIAAIAAEATLQLQAAEARAAALQERAEQTAQTATAGAALQRVVAALEAGGAFGSALDEIAAAGVAIPDGLTAGAGGVPTLRDLQAGFAEPARAALSASLKATVGNTALDRFAAFLRNQVGARSLAARDGPDPDAILSRAEAALATGDLATALSEIDALPEAGRAALADWMAQARGRQTALADLAVLAADLGR